MANYFLKEYEAIILLKIKYISQDNANFYNKKTNYILNVMNIYS